MAENPVDLARQLFDRLSRITDPTGRRVNLLDADSMAAIVDSLHPEIEMHEDPSFPEADTYRGVEAVRNYYAQFMESFDEFNFEAEDILDASGDRAVVLFHIRSRGKGSGATADTHAGWIYTFRDGKVGRIDAYLDRNEALAAAGL